MNESSTVMEYKCPCCSAGLHFNADTQKLSCEYCSNEFDLGTVEAVRASEEAAQEDSFQWEESQPQQLSDEEQESLNQFICPSCGGVIMTDLTTAATFCLYCGNPAVLPGKLSGGLRPDGVIPFRTDKEYAKQAFLRLCRGKPLLPKLFTQEQQVEKITGIYVPFWLYDCEGSFDGTYKATRLHHWADASYHYTRTDHFLLRRSANARFSGIPMDGSSKMDNDFMESIEPFDYSQLQSFDTTFLTGFFADRYDVSHETGQERVRQRVDASMRDNIQASLIGYSTAVPASRSLQVSHSKARFVLLPVWILNTRYKDKLYTFAMNGQTGKMTGAFPICPQKSLLWFSGICASVTVLATLIQLMM